MAIASLPDALLLPAGVEPLALNSERVKYSIDDFDNIDDPSRVIHGGCRRAPGNGTNDFALPPMSELMVVVKRTADTSSATAHVRKPCAVSRK
jgi:hypothetical protein